jgi:hypothetical protein
VSSCWSQPGEIIRAEGRCEIETRSIKHAMSISTTYKVQNMQNLLKLIGQFTYSSFGLQELVRIESVSISRPVWLSIEFNSPFQPISYP